MQIWNTNTEIVILGAEDYSVSTVGLNEATIRKYIEGKEKRDTALDQLSVREYEGPFKGGR